MKVNTSFKVTTVFIGGSKGCTREMGGEVVDVILIFTIGKELPGFALCNYYLPNFYSYKICV